MSALYYVTNTDSDLSGGADFNKKLLTSAGSSANLTLNFGNSEARTSYAFTEPNVQVVQGEIATYTITVNFSTTNAQGRLAISLSRLNSAGTVQQTSPATAEQTTGANRTFTLTDVNIGEFSATDRLRVNFLFRNNSTMAQSWDITFGTSTVDVSFIAPVNAIADVEDQELIILGGTAIQTTNDWYSWFFERERYILNTQATGNTQVTGLELESFIEEITASESENALIEIDGIQLTSAIEPITAFATQDATAEITGIELTATAETISGIGNGFITIDGIELSSSAEEITASGDGFIEITGIELNSTAKPITANGGAVFEVNGIFVTSEFVEITASGEATGVSGDATADAEAEEIAAIGDATVEVVGVELTSEIATITANSTGDITVEITGIELNSEVATITAIAISDGTAEVTGEELESFVEEISAIGGATAETVGQELDTDAEGISANGDAEIDITGIQLVSTAGTVTAFASGAGDAIASVEGVSAQTSLANISATAVSAEIIQLSGNPRRYAPNQFKYATVKLKGISTKIVAGRLKASGVSSIFAVANVQSVGMISEAPTISAEGIFSITEEELIMLLAA